MSRRCRVSQIGLEDVSFYMWSFLVFIGFPINVSFLFLFFLHVFIIMLPSCCGTVGALVRIFCCPTYLQTAGGDIGFPSAPLSAQPAERSNF